jgi:hypothetical protein
MIIDPKLWPAVWYGPDGQKAQFDSPLDVPEGWHDNPAKFDDPEAVSIVPGLEEANAASEGAEDDDDDDDDDDDGGIPLFDELTVIEIKERLTDAGVPFDNGETKQPLYDKLVAHMKSSLDED